MGHANMSITERYLHARPAIALAERFTRAFGGTGTTRVEAVGPGCVRRRGTALSLVSQHPEKLGWRIDRQLAAQA
jgi:hypothetical protein